MLISLKHRFIFVANLKTASSSIEICLRRFCEVAIPQTGFGKHSTFAEIEERFPWVFRYVRRENFFVFGVLRDPVDYVLSIYNSHTKTDFIGQRHYTGDVPFGAFYEDWKARQSWQLHPQITRFIDSKGNFALDYLLDYNALADQWPYFCRLLDVPHVALERYNASPEGIDRLDLSDAMVDRIYDDFDMDYTVLRECAGFVAGSDPAIVHGIRSAVTG